jgi:hypothetical protein
MQAELDALKQDYLEWTGGFSPETEEDIRTYVESSMPFDLDHNEATEALRLWMQAEASVEIRRDVDQH